MIVNNNLKLLIIILLIIIINNLIIIDTAPLIPIITALATSAISLFQIQIDTLNIAKYIYEQKYYHKRTRSAFVRDLLYKLFYYSEQKYNIIIFNLAEEHKQHLYGIKFYGSIIFRTDGTRFGIWIFDSGRFENHGQRGWHNWGMIGTFKKLNPDGSIIYFFKRNNNFDKNNQKFNQNNQNKQFYNFTTTTTTTGLPSITTVILPTTNFVTNKVTNSTTASTILSTKLLTNGSTIFSTKTTLPTTLLTKFLTNGSTISTTTSPIIKLKIENSNENLNERILTTTVESNDDDDSTFETSSETILTSIQTTTTTTKRPSTISTNSTTKISTTTTTERSLTISTILTTKTPTTTTTTTTERINFLENLQKIFENKKFNDNDLLSSLMNDHYDNDDHHKDNDDKEFKIKIKIEKNNNNNNNDDKDKLKKLFTKIRKKTKKIQY